MAALSRLEIEDQPFALYMLCKENGESFELTAFDGAESWAGKITKKQLKEMAGKVIALHVLAPSPYYMICLSIDDAVCTRTHTVNR